MLLLMLACVDANVAGVPFHWEDASGLRVTPAESLVIFNEAGDAWGIDAATGEIVEPLVATVYFENTGCDGRSFIRAPVPLTPVKAGILEAVRPVGVEAFEALPRSVLLDGQCEAIEDGAEPFTAVWFDDLIEAGPRPEPTWGGALHRVPG